MHGQPPSSRVRWSGQHEARSPLSRPGIRIIIDGRAFAQTNLRIGLGDDPDGLDPTLSRFYTTRIVFAGHVPRNQSDAFQTSLTLLENTLLAKWNIQFKDGSFYDLTKDPTGKTTVKDWTRRQAGANAPAGVALPLTTAQAKKLMGACFNITLLYNDPAAFAHAQSFSRRLVYDSIDFLDDGRLNLSVGATAIASNPATYGKGASAYTNATLQTLSPGTTLAMIYIINWNRTTGAWVSPERP